SGRARQGYADFRKLPRLRVDLDRAGVLLDDDVVTDREAEPGALSRRFRSEERIEYLLFHIRRNAGAVVPDPDFHTVTQAPRRGGKGWLIAVATSICLALRCGVEAVRNQIQQGPRDVLRKNVGLAGSRIKRSCDGDGETFFLCPRTVPGEVNAI